MARKLVLWVLGVAALLYIAVVSFIYAHQRNLLYHPTREEAGLESMALDGVEEVFFTTEDGVKLQAWYYKPKDAGKMVIFFHGNAGNITHRADKLKQLQKLGYGFIIPAWRGFGKSGGSPTQDGIYMDADATIDFVKSHGHELKDIIIIGESLGSGIATKVATEHDFKGLFLITPYTTVSDRASEIYFYLPVSSLIKDNFDNINNIEKVTEPVLIIHGDRDSIIPHAHSLKIIERAHDPKKLIIYPGKDHTDYDTELVFLEMDKFLNNSEPKEKLGEN